MVCFKGVFEEYLMKERFKEVRVGFGEFLNVGEVF